MKYRCITEASWYTTQAAMQENRGASKIRFSLEKKSALVVGRGVEWKAETSQRILPLFVQWCEHGLVDQQSGFGSL